MLQLQCDEDDEDDDGNDGLLSHKSHLGLQLVAQSRSCPEPDDPMQSKLHRIIIDLLQGRVRHLPGGRRAWRRGKGRRRAPVEGFEGIQRGRETEEGGRQWWRW